MQSKTWRERKERTRTSGSPSASASDSVATLASRPLDLMGSSKIPRTFCYMWELDTCVIGETNISDRQNFRLFVHGKILIPSCLIKDTQGGQVPSQLPPSSYGLNPTLLPPLPVHHQPVPLSHPAFLSPSVLVLLRPALLCSAPHGDVRR